MFEKFSSKFFDETFWLPDNVTWASFVSTPHVRYPENSDLYVCVLIVPAIIFLRAIFVRFVASKVGIFFGLAAPEKPAADADDADHDASPNPKNHLHHHLTNSTETILRSVFESTPYPTSKRVEEIVKRTDSSEADVLEWFRQQRNILRSSTKLDKFNECCVSFAWHGGIFAFGVYALHDKCWFMDTRHYWKDYPRGHELTNDIYAYYIASISYYSTEIVLATGVTTTTTMATMETMASTSSSYKRKDDLQMTLHHLITLSLLIISWWINHCRIGSVILVIHDFADIWLQLGKMARYVGAKKTTDGAFTVLAVSWFVTRLVIFPLYPVYSAAFESDQFVDYFRCGRVTVLHTGLALLLALLVMNALWFGRIIVAIAEKLRTGEIVDNRSDDEEE